jgi:hypothetical protein
MTDHGSTLALIAGGYVTMPLHDWAAIPGWDGVRLVWMVELLYWIKPRLPAGYRAYLGTTPAFAIGGPVEERPDVGVRDWPREGGTLPPSDGGTAAGAGGRDEEPDVETVVATLAGDTILLVERHGRMVAAIELVSPRNKDRASACAAYAATYAGYLLRGINLFLVDVHKRPLAFSFADRIAGELCLEQPSFPAPCAVAYRVGEPAPNGGRFLALWRRPLAIGSSLPVMRLPLSLQVSVAVDLEATYRRATEAAYLE